MRGQLRGSLRERVSERDRGHAYWGRREGGRNGEGGSEQVREQRSEGYFETLDHLSPHALSVSSLSHFTIYIVTVLICC